MTRTSLVGTWRLVSCERRTPDGHVDYPYGLDPVGYITYNDEGYMFVGLMKADRRRFVSEDRWQASAAESQTAFLTHLAYCGRYEIRGDKVVHRIEVCSSPNWTGVAQERFFEFDGDRLSLRTAPFVQKGVLRSTHLVWERA